MQAEPQVASGRFKPGMNSRKRKQLKVAAKFDELIAEYFPNGGYSVMDANRLKLAAQHYIDADLCRDPVVRQRATRTAEWPLSTEGTLRSAGGWRGIWPYQRTSVIWRIWSTAGKCSLGCAASTEEAGGRLMNTTAREI